MVRLVRTTSAYDVWMGVCVISDQRTANTFACKCAVETKLSVTHENSFQNYAHAHETDEQMK